MVSDETILSNLPLDIDVESELKKKEDEAQENFEENMRNIQNASKEANNDKNIPNNNNNTANVPNNEKEGEE